MFHNVYDMSCKSTSTRYGPHVPGIDISASMSFGGWVTPPQSARDSRRPSLAYSSLSEAPYSATSTDYTFSQPPTPSDSFENSRGPYHHLSGSAHNTPGHASSDSYVFGSLHEHLMQSRVQPQGQSRAKSTDLTQSYLLNSHQRHVEPMATDRCEYVPTDCWSGAQLAPQALHQHQSTGMAATLFDTSQALAMDTRLPTSMYSEVSAPLYSQSSTFICGNPQVVVPSQLTPQDDYMPDYSPYESPQQGAGAMSSDFSTSFDSTDSCVFPRAPSPEDAYFVSEDEDGFMHIKDEALWSPTPMRSSQLLNSTQLPHCLRRRRTTSKRYRKAPEPCRERRVGNITLQAKGEKFSADHYGIFLNAKIEKGRPKKYTCCAVDKDTGKICDRGFDRAEHLKRHAKMHRDPTIPPEYPCPIPDCKKKANAGMDRSDNATDHFLTHLEPLRPGRRNRLCDWATMEASIRGAYAEPQATKMLENIQKRVAKRKACGKWPAVVEEVVKKEQHWGEKKKHAVDVRSKL